MGDEQECADIGAIQAHLDGPTAFALQSAYRFEARKAFVHWDCGKRVQRAMIRNAAPVPGPYKTGDIVSYRREARLPRRWFPMGAELVLKHAGHFPEGCTGTARIN